MLRMMMLRGRTLMLRRRTGPKTETHTLCELAQSNCTWSFHNCHFVQKFTFKMPQAKTGDHTLCEPAPSKFISTLHKKHFMQEFTGKMPRTKIATHTLCEPAQSKCTWTLHKKHFMPRKMHLEFAGKMPRISWSWSTQTGDRTLCEPAPLDISQEPCYAENYR